MRSALFGILAIPVIIGLIAFSHVTQGCAESNGLSYNDHDRVLFCDNVTVGANNYTARVFEINDSVPRATVQGEHGVRVYILTESQMGNFTAGKDFTSVYNSTADGPQTVHLDSGKFWFVVDNRGSPFESGASIAVTHMAPRISQSTCVDRPFFVPDVSSGFIALALVLASVMAASMRKR